ncbi:MULTISPECIES: Rv0909 family putative TA system antitoxin [Streptomyces]|uniref:Antitoxin n=1 Tax=Streptomyces sp. NBC_00093 TaxID=2975649 RepID=A0AAU2A6U1_9ACTN
MGIIDKIKEQMRGKAGQNASDTAEKQINEKTGNKYTSQVDDAQQRVEGAMGMDRDRDPNRPDQP